MTSLLPFLIFVCAPPHLCHLLTPSDLICLPSAHVHLPSATSAPTPRCTHVSQLATGCVTCHTSHGCVTHFRPILGNLVEVTLVTSPFMYIVSHTKGTSFP